MIIVSRIIHVTVDRRLNVTNKFIYQRRLSSRLAIVMFRGTPCNFHGSRSRAKVISFQPIPPFIFPFKEQIEKIKIYYYH